MTVSFFGHRDAPHTLSGRIRDVLEILIDRYGADTFYVGNNGSFDSLVLNELSYLKSAHQRIDICIVLAYNPKTGERGRYAFDTLYPEAAARAIPKFAISARNRWMVSVSDIAVTYVTHSYGGAARAKAHAISEKKKIIELSEQH